MIAMEERLTDRFDSVDKRFDSVDDKLDKIPPLDTRLTVVEVRGNTLVRGVWVLFTCGAGALFTYLIGYLKH